MNPHLSDPDVQQVLGDQYILQLSEEKLRRLAETVGLHQYKRSSPEELITGIFEKLAQGVLGPDNEIIDTPTGSPNMAMQAVRAEMKTSGTKVARVIQINEILVFNDGEFRTWMAPTDHVVIVDWPDHTEQQLMQERFLTPCDTLCHIWYSTGGRNLETGETWKSGWYYMDAWVNGDPETPKEIRVHQAFGPFPAHRAVMAAIYRKYPIQD